MMGHRDYKTTLISTGYEPSPDEGRMVSAAFAANPGSADNA